MYLDITIKLVIGLVLVILVLRLMGRKELAQITPLDLIFVTTVSELLGGAALGEEVKLGHLVFVLSLWFGLIYALEQLTKYKRMREVVEVEPTVLIRNGIVNKYVMNKERMTMNDIEAQLRSKVVFDFHEVEIAILEVSGKISVKRK